MGTAAEVAIAVLGGLGAGLTWLGAVTLVEWLEDPPRHHPWWHRG